MSLLTKVGGLVAQARAAGQAIRSTRTGGAVIKAAPTIAAGVATGATGFALGGGFAGDRPRRRSRGITARDYRTTQRTLRKISKMYQKLPKRSSHKAPVRVGGRRTEIVNVD